MSVSRMKELLLRRMCEAVANPPQRVIARDLLARGLTANEVHQLVVRDPSFDSVPYAFRVSIANAALRWARTSSSSETCVLRCAGGTVTHSRRIDSARAAEAALSFVSRLGSTPGASEHSRVPAGGPRLGYRECAARKPEKRRRSWRDGCLLHVPLLLGLQNGKGTLRCPFISGSNGFCIE
jgi:hypothetical protein